MLIVAENASAKFGGEAILPLHYFRLLRKRGIEAWLVVNARTKAELEPLLASDIDRVSFVPDTKYHQWTEKLGKPLPPSVKHFTFRYLGRIISGRTAKKMIRQLVTRNQIDIVHQPMPVSPKEISLIHTVGVPVVIGPMNGGIAYPPGFQDFQKGWIRAFVGGGRFASRFLHHLMPGKLRAQTLLVANERTAKALPSGVQGQIETLVENGVDLSLWSPRETRTDGPVRFVFSGRLADWKGVQYLLKAFEKVIARVPASLAILGNGAMRAELEAQTKAAGLTEQITFHGWMSQQQCAAILGNADVFVLPSLYECGGAVVLEAMASGLPVIATNWGGPADYLDASCGILVDPESPSVFVDRLAEKMLQLATDPVARTGDGLCGSQKSGSGL